MRVPHCGVVLGTGAEGDVWQWARRVRRVCFLFSAAFFCVLLSLRGGRLTSLCCRERPERWSVGSCGSAAARRAHFTRRCLAAAAAAATRPALGRALPGLWIGRCKTSPSINLTQPTNANSLASPPAFPSCSVSDHRSLAPPLPQHHHQRPPPNANARSHRSFGSRISETSTGGYLRACVAPSQHRAPGPRSAQHHTAQHTHRTPQHTAAHSSTPLITV